MTKKLLLVVVGLNLVLGACAGLAPEGEIQKFDGLSAIVYKDPT
jgi:hypothetical protein